MTNENLIERFMNEFDFHSFFCFCNLIKDPEKEYSSMMNMVVSYIRERGFAQCTSPESSFKVTHIDEQGIDFVVESVLPDNTKFLIELKTSTEIVTKKGRIGAKGKIKMSNHRGKTSFDEYMKSIDGKINSDIYFFIDTTSYVIFWAKKSDIVNDKDNWKSSGDGVTYQLKESSTFINRKHIKIDNNHLLNMMLENEAMMSKIERAVDEECVRQIEMIRNKTKEYNDKTVSIQNMSEISRRKEQSTENSFVVVSS